MDRKQRSKYEMLVRSDVFGNDYNAEFPGESEAGKAFAVIKRAVKEVGAFDVSNQTEKRFSSGEKAAAKRAVLTQLAAIGRSTRVLAKTLPGADERFPMPKGKADVTVLQAGRLFVQEATQAKERLGKANLPASFLEDLQAAVAEFEKAIGGRSGGKTAAVVARKRIHAALKEGLDAVRSLDALIPNVLGNNGAAMDRWKTDRRIRAAWKGGPVVGKPAETPDGLTALDAPDPPLEKVS